MKQYIKLITGAGFLIAMIDAESRDGVRKLIGRADRARRPRP